MERVLADLNAAPSKSDKGIGDLLIRKRIIDSRDDREQLLMRISDGDIVQYESIKRSSVRDFLNKFTIFVEGLKNSNKTSK
jgi:hypothetical protein